MLKSLVFALALWGVASSSFAQVGGPTRKEIQARYDALDAAYLKKDSKTIQTLFSNDCVIKLEAEPTKLKAPQYVSLIARSFSSITVQKVVTSIGEVKPVKDAPGAFDVTATTKSEYKYQAPTSGKAKVAVKKLKGVQIVVDTWKKTENGWQITGRLVKSND